MYKKYLRADGTKTGWLKEPENNTDRRLFTLGPLTRKFKCGETFNHANLGMLHCVTCTRVVNEDQCGEWDGPSFIGEFVAID